MTNREVISEVVNDLRALGVDDHVSLRYILAKLQGYTAIFVKREADLRRLYRSSDIWTTIECFKLRPAVVSECCNITIPFCNSLMKSVEKLPETYSTNFGNVIREVSSINNTVLFEQVTPRQYQAIKLRPFHSKKKKYYWIENGYLVVPDSDVELVKVTGYFKDPDAAKRASACSEQEDSCNSPLDEKFTCPEYLLQVVKQETIKDLFNFYKRVIPDQAPDGIIGNAPQK